MRAAMACTGFAPTAGKKCPTLISSMPSVRLSTLDMGWCPIGYPEYHT
jgi:hypothetical protein